MSRDAQRNAQSTYDQSKALTKQSEQNSNSLYNELDPMYTNEAVNPTGYNARDLSSMNTAIGQSTGGAAAGAASEGNLEAARTGNEGGFNTSLDKSVRDSVGAGTAGALSVQGANANLKEQQKQEGITGLQGLDSQQNNDVLSSLGLQTQANNSLISAGQSGWFQNMLGLMNASGNLGKGVGSAMSGYSDLQGGD